MAQKIVVICDRHLETTGEEVEGRAWTFGVSPEAVESPEVFAVDLCDDCAKDLTDVARMVAELGRPVQPSRRTRAIAAAARRRAERREAAADELPCPFPDCGRSFDTQQGVAMHFRRTHGVTLKAWEADHA